MFVAMSALLSPLLDNISLLKYYLPSCVSVIDLLSFKAISLHPNTRVILLLPVAFITLSTALE
jgi:hypothetical protein